MKYRFFVVLIISTLSGQLIFGQGGYSRFNVNGDVSKVNPLPSMVYLTYVVNGERKTDSSRIEKGTFHFSGAIEEPIAARFRAVHQPDSLNRSSADQVMIFLEPGTITVTAVDSFSNVQVKGSKAHDAYKVLAEKLDPLNTKMDKLDAEYSALVKKKDDAGMKKMIPRYDSLEAVINKVYKDYLTENPSSPIAMYAMTQFAGWDINPDEAEPVFNSLPAKTRNLPSGKVMREKIEIAKRTAVGRTAMDFTQNDTLGNPVSLFTFRGKYLLVDFWASWCGPCRRENPNVVAAFNKYKDKGFHILSVSLDKPDAKEKWLKAIHDDGLIWTHVSDLKFWNNAVAVQYGIQSIPQNLLIDPAGRIIAKNLRGEELQKKLKELFGEP
jgi:peroxiredoxin